MVVRQSETIHRNEHEPQRIWCPVVIKTPPHGVWMRQLMFPPKSAWWGTTRPKHHDLTYIIPPICACLMFTKRHIIPTGITGRILLEPMSCVYGAYIGPGELTLRIMLWRLQTQKLVWWTWHRKLSIGGRPCLRLYFWTRHVDWRLVHIGWDSSTLIPQSAWSMIHDRMR